MTDEQNDAEEQAPAAAPECGRLLKRTREKLGLSIEDVSAELHLSAFQIRALEEDDWDKLPGTTYARGYLKSYARMLGLDAEQLLAGASTQEIEITRAEPEIETRPEKKKDVREKKQPRATTETREKQKEPEEAEERGPEAQPRRSRAPLIAALGVCALLVVAWQYRGELQTLTDPGGGENAPAGSAAEGTEIATERDAGLDDPQHAGDVAAVPPLPDEGLDATGAIVADDTDGAAMMEQPVTPTEPGRVVFQFDESSWIDVRDSLDERLLYRSYQQGRRIEVEGQPPFRIYLGNARGVQVEYLGETIAPDASSGRLYARFVLGAPSG